MKVTSDRIKARAEQLRSGGFKLSGSMVRRTLELNAGVRMQPSPSRASKSEKAPENQASDQKHPEAA